MEVRDSAGNLVSAGRPAVTLALGANPGAAPLHGSTTVNAVGGVATFSGISVETAAAGYTLVASASGLGDDTSAAFTVTPATPKALQWITYATVDTAGHSLPFAVRAVDRFGNLTPTIVGAVFVSRRGGPVGAAVLFDGDSWSLVGGVADLSQVKPLTAGQGYYFVATGSGGAAGLDSAYSPGLTVYAAPAAALAFTQQPSVAFLGEFLLASHVQVRDLYGNLASEVETVTFSVGTNPWGGRLSGTLSQTGAQNLVFGGTMLDKPGVGYTLVASATGLTPATSTGFSVLLPSTTFDMTAGDSHSCAVVASNYAACWGDNTYGQLGNAGGGDSVPVLVAGGHSFSGLTAGARHTCAIETSSSAAYCWGDNGKGQLGNAAAGSQSMTPVAVAGGLQFVALAAGGAHTCGIATDSAAYCWGDNGNGQLGDSGKVAQADAPTPVYGGRTYLRVTAGDAHSCAVQASGAAFCWGDDTYGQLGDGTSTVGGSDTAVAVQGGLALEAIAAGAAHTCGVVQITLTQYCWGHNNHGQLGDGNLGVDADHPVTMTNVGTFANGLTLGGDHSCAIYIDGFIYCWGANAAGELGNGGVPTDSDQPVKATATTSANDVAAGVTHTCGIYSTLTGYKSYCWGGNAAGQLGDGTTTDRSIPTLVREP